MDIVRPAREQDATATTPGHTCDGIGRMFQDSDDDTTITPSASVDVPGAPDALSQAAQANEAAVASVIAAAPTRGGAFTIPLLCAGIALIAACILIPQADANRRLAYERLRLQADLETVEKQVKVNDEFVTNVSDDPTLAERLAQRQMRIIREGNKVLPLKSDADEMSPFQLTAVPEPAPLPPYEPRGGVLASACYNPKSRLYLIGIGLLAVATGLVLGVGGRERAPAP